MWKELKGKKIIVFDKETDGFVDDMTTIHCGTLIDAVTKKLTELGPDAIEGITKELDEYDVIVGHNIIGYDLVVLKKWYDWEPKKHVIILDTLWMSRMYSPDMEGGHSLGAWGHRLGDVKQEYYPVIDPEQPVYNKDEKNPSKNPCWTGSIYTKRMGDYCTQDVRVNVKLFWKLVNLLKNFSWQSIICEMNVAILIQRQMEHGFVFDYAKAEILHAKFLERIAELEDEVHNTFRPLPKLVREIQPRVKMNGVVSSVGLKKLGNWEELISTPEFTRHEKTVIEGYTGPGGNREEVTRIEKSVEYHSGSFSLIEWPEFSLGSRQQIGERLTIAGYKLTKKTKKGNMIIDDAVLQHAVDAGIAEAKPLAEYFVITKREGMVKDWLSRSRLEDDGSYVIHGYVNSMGAVTHRMTHSSPNIAQAPAAKKDKKTGDFLYGLKGNYGADCRQLFIVRPGYKLVGCDASGLELRCLANYMKDAAYTDTLLNGDIHTANQEAAGLPTRDMAKTFIYGFLYGAGDKKIGSIVDGNGKIGKALKEQFLRNTPALKKLRENVIDAAESRGWLKGIDGRILRVRHGYAALNTLLQGMGAIVMKYWLVEVAKVADAEGLDWNPVANIHDEGQFEVVEAHTERFAEICEESFPIVSKQLGSKCLLEGKAMIGSSWKETH